MTTCGEIDDVLAEVAAAADARPAHDVAEVPDLGAVANHRALVDEGGFVREVVSHAFDRLRMGAGACRTQGRAANVGGQLHRRPGVVDAESAAGEHLLVDARVQIGKAVAELDLFAVHLDRSKRRLRPRLRRERKIGRFGREEPAHVGPLELERAGRARRFAQVHLGRADRPEQPQQQIEEMDADVGDDATGSILVALPRHLIPAAARRDVGQRHLMPRRTCRRAVGREAPSAADADAAAARSTPGRRSRARAPAVRRDSTD